METQEIVLLDPAVILADDNSRYNLKKPQIDSLAASIIETGEVLQPVEVEKLVPAQKPFLYRLTSGYYRKAAVEKINSESAAGLKLPAIVREPGDPVTRLRHQIAENLERTDQSPMDKAVAMKKLLDSGLSRGEVRRIFAVATGNKTITKQPMSNAMLNIMLRFLELPKSIQEKIHDGRVGIAAAYELGRVPADKRQAVLDRAEADRAAQLEKEEKDEEKYLLAEKRLSDARAKEHEAAEGVEAAKAAITAADALVVEKITALREIQKAPGYLEMDAKGQKEVTDAMKTADADVKAAQRLAKDAKNNLAKLLKAREAAEQQAADQQAKLDASRKAVKKTDKGKSKGSAVGVEDVKKAAKAEGVDSGYVPLSLQDIRAAVKDAINQSSYPKVALVAKAFKDCFDGKSTPKELIHDVAVMTGEVRAAAPVKAGTAVAKAAAKAATKTAVA